MCGVRALDIISHVWNGMPLKIKMKKTIAAKISSACRRARMFCVFATCSWTSCHAHALFATNADPNDRGSDSHMGRDALYRPCVSSFTAFLVQFGLDKDSRIRCPKIHKWEMLQKKCDLIPKTTQTNNTKTHQTPTQPRHEIGSHKPFFAMRNMPWCVGQISALASKMHDLGAWCIRALRAPVFDHPSPEKNLRSISPKINQHQKSPTNNKKPQNNQKPRIAPPTTVYLSTILPTR